MMLSRANKGARVLVNMMKASEDRRTSMGFTSQPALPGTSVCLTFHPPSKPLNLVLNSQNRESTNPSVHVNTNTLNH